MTNFTVIKKSKSMSVPFQFTIPKNILFSVGLPSAEKTFYQLSEKESKKQCLEENDKNKKNRSKFIHKGKPTGNIMPKLFMVKDETTSELINWDKNYKPIATSSFDSIYQKMIGHLGKNEIWIRDSLLLNDEGKKITIRNIGDDACSDLIVHQTFLHPSKKELEKFDPEWYFIHSATFTINSNKDPIKVKKFIIFNFRKKVVLIGGTPLSETIIDRITPILTANFI